MGASESLPTTCLSSNPRYSSFYAFEPTRVVPYVREYSTDGGRTWRPNTHDLVEDGERKAPQPDLVRQRALEPLQLRGELQRVQPFNDNACVAVLTTTHLHVIDMSRNVEHFCTKATAMCASASYDIWFIDDANCVRVFERRTGSVRNFVSLPRNRPCRDLAVFANKLMLLTGQELHSFRVDTSLRDLDRLPAPEHTVRVEVTKHCHDAFAYSRATNKGCLVCVITPDCDHETLFEGEGREFDFSFYHHAPVRVRHRLDYINVTRVVPVLCRGEIHLVGQHHEETIAPKRIDCSHFLLNGPDHVYIMHDDGSVTRTSRLHPQDTITFTGDYVCVIENMVDNRVVVYTDGRMLMY